MKRRKIVLVLLALSISLVQCKDYLDTSSPSNTDDQFVTATPSEAFKILSWCYANYRQNSSVPLYNWNDPIGSDVEMYPEGSSTNNISAIMLPELLTVDAMKDAFNNLYTTLARAVKVSNLIKEKDGYKTAITNGQINDWTQLYGEAITMKAFCYFNLVKHFGDVPYGFENTYVTDYGLTSRFDIYDALIAEVRAVEPFMYKIGEGGITAERFSRTFADALVGQMALFAGGYQTIRTDNANLYGEVQFSRKGIEVANSVYARRTDYQNYYKIADEYLQKAMDNSGTAKLIETDERSHTSNPFQRHFQYMQDLQVSPESLFEVGNIQGGQAGQTTNSDYPYNFGRPSNGGGNNAAPTKTFAGVRIIPVVYYNDFQNGDRRRDVSATVTGSTGDGNETMLSFVPGSKLDGGIALNKWDENRMSPPYSAAQRQAGINHPVLRMADVILMLAEVKAELGDAVGALELVNTVRQRAFGNSAHNLGGLNGDALKEAIWDERKLEFVGEGIRRWDMIRSGKFSAYALEVRSMMKTMIAALKTKGYYQFPNGNIIANYIYTKNVALVSPLTFEAKDASDPVLYPGWRGQYDWSKTALKVIGTTHNTAIKGLFDYIDPNSELAKSLESEGYKKTRWAIDIVNNESSFDRNIISGIKTAQDPPRYFFPIPFETVSKSKGKITNGYGLPQQ